MTFISKDSPTMFFELFEPKNLCYKNT